MTNRHTFAAGGLARRGGFTALEIAAVAAIIAIMSLILIPIMRNRIEEARIAATKDDLAQIEKAEMMAFGYTGHYFRLQDLAKPQVTLEQGMTPDEELRERAKAPNAYWNEPVPSTQRVALAESWRGPFMAVHKSRSVQDLLDDLVHEAKFRTMANDQVNGTDEGPILVLDSDNRDHVSVTDDAGLRRAMYPLDPWGNPYLFFGNGRVGDRGGTTPFSNSGRTESNFGTAAAYSLGPDGLPGNARNDISINYYRQTGFLGEAGSDDIGREF